MLLDQIILIVAAVFGLLHMQLERRHGQFWATNAFDYVEEFRTQVITAVSSQVDECMATGYCGIATTHVQSTLRSLKTRFPLIPDIEFVNPIKLAATKTKFVAFESAAPTPTIFVAEAAGAAWFWAISTLAISVVIIGFLIYLNRSTKTVTSTVAAWNGWRSELFVAVGCDIDALLPALSDRTTTALALDASSDLKINFDLNNILPAPLVNNPCSPVTVTVAPALNTYLTQIASTRKEGRLQQRRNNANKQREFKRSHDLAALLAKESKGVRTDEAEAAELMRAAVEQLDTTAGDLEVYLLSSTATKAERTAATLRRCKASRDDAEKARDKSIDTQCDWEAKNERKMNGMKSIERKLESKREEVNNLNDDILPLRAAYHPIAHYMPLHVHYISTANAILQQDVIDWEALNAQKAQRKVYLDQISLSQLPLLTEVNRLRSLHDWMVARYITWTAWKFDDYDEENEETEMKFEVDIDGDAIMA